MFTSSIRLMLAAAILIISMAAATTTLVDGQQEEDNAAATTTFQSIDDGFRIQVPNGWVVQDIDNTNVFWQRYEEQNVVGGLAYVCPQEETQLAVGGTFECKLAPPPPSLAPMSISRFKDLDKRPELASIQQNQTNDITISDFYAFYMRFLEWGIPPREEPHNLQVVNETDMTVNVINAQTNQTVATVPGKIVEVVFPVEGGEGEGPSTTLSSVVLLTLNGTTGYAIFYGNPLFAAESDQPPRPVQQILDSFELLQ
jgi:hypothetical protein